MEEKVKEFKCMVRDNNTNSVEACYIQALNEINAREIMQQNIIDRYVVTDVNEVSDIRPCEFYSIGEDGVHISGYLWNTNDGTDKDYVLTEYTFCIVPLDEFIERYKKDGIEFIEDIEASVKQYEERDITEERAIEIFNNYSENQIDLDYCDITKDTPFGNYRMIW